jgi:hypothetical protein
MTSHHARKNGRLYRYYVSMAAIKRGENDGVIRQVPAGPVDQAVVEQIRRLVRAPEIVAKTVRAAGLDLAAVKEALSDFDRIGMSYSRRSRPGWCGCWSGGWMSAMAGSASACGQKD